MRIYGINDSGHDAALSIVENGEILFAAHSERYNKEKNTYAIHEDLVAEALSHGPPDVIAYFERRNKKRLRKMLYGGLNGQYDNLYRKSLKHVLNAKEIQLSHHYSHACAGYFTSTFDQATIVVIDAIGEFDTATVWHANGTQIRKKLSLKYPVSFGLFYSAFTSLLGLRAGTEEYILMGMSAYGNGDRYVDHVEALFPRWNKQTVNFHTGIPKSMFDVVTAQDRFDLAAAVQSVYEKRLIEFMRKVRSTSPSGNLVFMGGNALNCVANTLLFDIWEEVWIMPNPGDAGSSLGAAAALSNRFLKWKGPYLGSPIGDRYPVNAALSRLLDVGIVGVASGRSEFGPRALGNRSLLADPRSIGMKDKVNEVKQREMFRPFAPIVMEEHASEWFEMDRPSPYMQFAFKCLQPDLVPAIVHVDGTSRVQTVNEYQHPDLYKLLYLWNESTGIPMLLNTSLNVKNQPLLNDMSDVAKWKTDNPSVEILV